MTAREELEREWKKERDPGVTVVLRDYYLERALEPEKEFARLENEVELDVERVVLEELSSEHGNFEREPWKVQILTDSAPAQHHTNPEYILGGVELWVYRTTYHPDGTAEIRHVLEFAPEHMESDLRRAHGQDVEFHTVYGGFSREYIADQKTGQVWQLIHESGLGERECPFAEWDPETREDRPRKKWPARNTVQISDTWYGNHPGENCRLCDEKIGEEHGDLYMGEGTNEAIYMPLEEEEQLRSTIDTPEIQREIEEAFEAFRDSDRVDVFFEHGQWWVRATDIDRDDESGRNDVDTTYSVVDTNRGFGFEEV